MPQRLGQGPILVHKDALVHYDYQVTQGLEQAAADAIAAQSGTRDADDFESGAIAAWHSASAAASAGSS